ncbi:protein NKG7-like isoform 1-T1 [Liasis olivaceus]
MSWSEIMTTGFTLCTLFTLVFAVMDHRWIKVETEKQTYYSGLWKVCLKLVCSGLITSAPNAHGAKTLLVMALFCGFVGASFMTFTYRYSSSFTIYRYLVAALGSFITAALVFLGLSIYTIRVSTHGVSRTSTVSYLWSFYLAWVTCPFFIISGFLGLMAHQRLLLHGSVLSDKESVLTASSSNWSSSSSVFWDEEEWEKILQEKKAEEFALA